METNVLETETVNTFKDFGLSEAVLDGVKAAGFITPSPIQLAAIPAVMSGADVIGQAQTGTGKTAAYTLPALSRLKDNKTVEILVLCPTRELATQVSDEMFRLGKFAGVKTVPVVGGAGLMRQVELVNRGAQVIVATPGRLLDHMREGRLKKFTPHTIILDEADEMLDMGFVDDIREILRQIPAEGRQVLLFSATMPPGIRALANEFMKDPVHIKLNSEQQTNIDIEQRLHVVRADEKEHALLRIIDVEDPAKAIIFCRTKRDVDEVTETLMGRGIAARAIHGDMAQPQRNQTVDLLKRGQIRIVIATDVAARGLDIRGVTHVINYHVPDNRERYVHRIGRTGRAGESGIAITLATPGDLRNNDCFDKKHAADFIVSAIPNRAAALARRGRAMAETIGATQISSDWLETVREMIASGESTEELLQRMFSLLMGKRQILGQDNIGLPKDQAQKFLDRDSSRSGGGRPPFGRGGFSGRKPPFGKKPFGSKRPFGSDDRGPRGPRTERGASGGGSYRPAGDRPDRGPSGDGRRSFDRDRAPAGDRDRDRRPPPRREFHA